MFGLAMLEQFERLGKVKQPDMVLNHSCAAAEVDVWLPKQQEAISSSGRVKVPLPSS